MSLLPKTFHDFSSKKYWNNFFTKRGEKAFEWYGEYTELCGLLHKFIRPNDNILVAGCGNSTLSADLYKVGYRSITNVDNSEVVIRQMQDKHKTSCPQMVWSKMDLTQMEYQDDSFSCVLDKALLDALMTDDSNSVVDLVNKYLNEVCRVLRVGGRFVCVSLLQEHILKHILQFFTMQHFLIRICRCEDAEKSQERESNNFSFPVFVVVCTKFKKMPNLKPVMELQLDGIEGSVRRVETVMEVIEQITEVQQYAVLTHSLKHKSSPGESTSLQLCDGTTGSVRYTLYVVESPSKQNAALKFAVFIVPPGREREWLFGSAKGRLELCESAGASRLVVAHLHPSANTPLTLQQVQDELSARVMQLAPAKMNPNIKVPFLSVGEEMGEVKEVTRGHSDYSGTFIIEDLYPPGAPPIRRLVFLGNQAVVQSEARIFTGQTSKNKTKKKKKKGGGGGGGVVAVERSSEVAIDRSYLSCSHHLGMISGVCLSPTTTSPLLVIGLGGGALAAYIHTHFNKTRVVAVELDPAMVEVAQKWFGFKVDERLKVEVCDGLDYVKKAAEEGEQFGCILFDVDSKDVSEGLSCPPQSFLQPAFLKQVYQCLEHKGLLIMNLVCRDEEIRDNIVRSVKNIFPLILVQKVPEEVNCILHCFKDTGGLKDEEEIKLRFKQKVAGLCEGMKDESNVEELNGMVQRLTIW